MTGAVVSAEGKVSGTGEAAPIRVFISYRRDDVGWEFACAIESSLAHHFGGDNVFRDITSLERFAGLHFEPAIDEALGLSDVEVLLIGTEWAGEENRRRLEDETDLHRREIEGALTRGIKVVPVFKGTAKMPEAADLPSSLAELSGIQGCVLGVDHYQRDVEVLIARIEERAAERRLEIKLKEIEDGKTAQEESDRALALTATRAGEAGDFERARHVANAIEDLGRRVDALVDVAGAQVGAGASDEAAATLDLAQEVTPQIEDTDARGQARERVQVGREECVRELTRHAREVADAGGIAEARAALDAARAAAGRIEATAQREAALVEIEEIARGVGPQDTELEKEVRKLVTRARKLLGTDALDDADAALESARARAREIADDERRNRALALVVEAATELRDRQWVVGMDSRDAEREQQVGELLVQARELPDGAVGAVEELLGTARGVADEIEDDDRRAAACALVDEAEQELLGAGGSFAAAIRLGGEQGSVRGDNTDATKDEGEPNHAGNEGGKSVWYRWTAPADGAVTFDTVGSEFDTLLAVYRGSAVNGLESVASSDDAVGILSRVRFLVVEGEEYKIAVDGYGAAAGAFTLNWDARPLANDAFACAEEITGEADSVSGDTTGATKEEGEPDHAGNPGGKSVWYRWTAPADGAVTIDTAGSEFDTLLAVYRGSALAELEQVAANDDAQGRTSRVLFPVVEGAEYKIAVDGFGGAAGAFDLNWNMRPSLVELMRQSGLAFSEIGNGAFSVPFPGEKVSTVEVKARELGDGVAFFTVDLPDLTGFGSGTVLKALLGISFAVDYVKALQLSGDRYALAAEVPVAALTPPICQGLICCLVPMGDVSNKPEFLSHIDTERMAKCREVQERFIALDTDRVRVETSAMLIAAGIQPGPGGFEFDLGPETRPMSVVVNPRAISFVITLQGVRPHNNEQRRALLEVNCGANVAKVGLDSHGDVVLLYEVPGVFPGLMAHMGPALADLHARVAGVL